MSMSRGSQDIREAVKDTMARNPTAGGTLPVGATPGGADTQVQFNDAGTFGGDPGFTYIKGTDLAILTGTVDGDYEGLRIINSQANVGASLNETAQLRFGFGNDLDVARIIAGKLADYTTSAESDSSLLFNIDNNGTSTTVMRIYGLGTDNSTATPGLIIGTPQGTTATSSVEIHQLDPSAFKKGDLITAYGPGSPSDIRYLYLNNAGVLALGAQTVGSTNSAVINLNGMGTSSSIQLAGHTSVSQPGSITFASATGGVLTGRISLTFVKPSAAADRYYLLFDEEDNTALDAEDPQIQFGDPVTPQILTLTSGNTITNQRQFQFSAPIIKGVAGGPTETVTNSATVYIDKSPINGGNVTLTNAYALWVNAGNVRIDGNLILGGVTTVGSYGVPAIVVAIDTTGLTDNVGATTMYAVPSTGAGMYRVSSLVVETTAGSISSTLPNVQILYTDNETGGVITIDATPILGIAGIGQTGALTANTVGTTSTGVIVINAKASTNIQYSTVNYASNLAGMTYALHVKLEAL